MKKNVSWFKRCLLLIPTLIFGAFIYAQDLNVTGTVTSTEDGQPIPGVSVLQKGTSNGTITDISGMYNITVPQGSVLVFSFIGMASEEVTVTSVGPYDIEMQSETEGLDEVVVTALGIEREKKSLGYAMQEVEGNAVVDAREQNLANTLSGKVSGLQVVRGAGGPSGSSKIILRGNNSLTGDNQPLIVVDGMPINNFTDGAEVDQWGSGDGRDFGSGIGDLNADDIESMSVLKGASAAALYGSRAGNGVILITTKKGTKGKGAGFTINSRFGVESLLTQPELQDEFGQGSDGIYDRMSGSSWGPKAEGQMVDNWEGKQVPLQTYDNVENFFRTGTISNHNISFSQQYNKTSVFASLTRFDNKSMIPETDVDRTTFTVRVNTEFGENERWKFDSKVSYINSNSENRPLPGIAAQNNTFFTIWTLPRSIDIREFNPSIDEDGNQIWWDDGNTPQGNPWWNLQYGKNTDTRDRFMGFMMLAYEFNPWLSAEIKGGTDFYTTKKEEKIHTGGIVRPAGVYSKNFDEVYENNLSFLVKMQKDDIIDRLGTFLTFGGNLMHQKSQGMGGNSGDLVVPNLFALNNGENPPTVSERFSERKMNSLYGSLQLNWDGYLFLDATMRNDWSSTLSEDNRSFLYPSISLSGIVTDMLDKNGIDVPSWITYAKVRGSYAEVGNDLNPYELYNTYSIGKSPSPHEQTTAQPGSTLYDSGVVNELIKSYELGFDIRFINNRFGLDFTWYKTNATNQLIKLPLDSFSGYKNKIVNAGNIQNKGIEIMLDADIFRNPDGFNWTVTANMSQNENKILELEGDVEEYSLGAVDDLKIVAMVGGDYGEMYGKKMLRVEDEVSQYFGQVIVDESGLPIKGDEWEYLGNQQPDWMVGITNSFSYKNLMLSFLLDMKFGGKIFSGTTAFTHGRGVAAGTVVNGEREEFVYEGVVDNGDGTYAQNSTAVSPELYWGRVASQGNLGITDEFTYDASSIRIRNLKLGYKLPTKWFNDIPIVGADVSIIGNNVWLIDSDTPGIDPESVIGVGTNAIGMEMGSPPTMKSWTFNLSLKF
ncbi:SusC/RagA family TonB-linked outer membrane protein [Carboxylicivirga marina]|uniref:SusC/RagA family TonB-linked outer membrane protein n=1 Tax=Carboxylicivirga marina TaxID=2800988 RepID=A0ABS1HFK5_9BACT|nr:SusC/RagA family TonB-linked outer membrane protein [Carboxylicivirga marina]MBK3516391.1 SusC/RagA family TonB-linked outer membrane protein [Carboxylicivirga marina]